MWYFSWILGLGLACIFGILNAIWFELREGHGHVVLEAGDPLHERADGAAHGSDQAPA